MFKGHLELSAIEHKSDNAKIFCVLKIYLKKREYKIVDV